MSIIKITYNKDELINRNNGGSRVITSHRLLLSVIIGFIIGFCFGYYIILLSDLKTPQNTLSKYKYDTGGGGGGGGGAGRAGEGGSKLGLEFENFTKHSHLGENTTVAEKLYNDIKVLCWILTSPENHETRAKHVNLTWGRRCNKLIFISSEDDEDLGAINLNITEGRENLWYKTRAAFNYIHENYINDYDWFLKADDDTYFIMENLRYMLSEHRNDTPIYFGCKFQMPSVIYMSGGAGYVLSREAVKRLVEIAFKNSQICRQDASVEDMELGVCLQAVGVLAGDSRDEEGKSRFHSLGLENQLEPNTIGDDFWLWNWSYYKFGSGLRYVSDKAISFHYLTSSEMYISEYLIYHVKPYGIWSIPENLPEVPLTLDEELEKIRKADSDRNLI